MKKSIANIIFWSFALVWFFILVLDYFNKTVPHLYAFAYFKQAGVVLFLAIWIGIVMLIKKYYFQSKFERFLFSYLGVLFQFIVLCVGIAFTFSFVIDAHFGFGSIFYFLRQIGIPILGFAFILFSAYNLANAFFRLVKWPIDRHFIILCFGFFLFSIILFFLAYISQLKLWIVLAILIVSNLLNYKSFPSIFSNVFKSQLFESSKRNYLSAALFILILFVVAINFLAIQGPFPLGFDSRNYYVNLPKLLAENGAIIPGFQPYPWGLIMSIGFVVFDSARIAMMMSTGIGILCGFYGYYIFKKYFNLSDSLALLACLFYFLLPAVTNQLWIEIKIDFGLLFVQLCLFELIILFVRKVSKSSIDKAEFLIESSGKWDSILIVFVLLNGFALSIKLTHLFFLFAFFILFWTIRHKYIGFIFSFMSIFATILIFEIDNISSLQAYHLSIPYLKYLLPVIVIGLLFLLIKQNVWKTWRSMVLHFTIALGVLLPISPWIVKNYSDTKSLNPNTLLIGSSPGPEVILQ